jgi:hypothetical protein
MADVNLNALVDGVSGKVGRKIVLRQRGGRTLLSTRPDTVAEPTEKQLQHRERFRLAARYARGILLNPVAKAEYEQVIKDDAFLNPYAAAVADYLKAPEIAGVDSSNYRGQPGEPIIIRSTKDYKLVSVLVSLQRADGTEIEKGNAVSEGTRLEWKYVAKTVMADLAGAKVVVTASDRPGNQTTVEYALD